MNKARVFPRWAQIQLFRQQVSNHPDVVACRSPAVCQPQPSDGSSAIAWSALPPDFCHFHALLPAMQLRAFSSSAPSAARLDPATAQLMFQHGLSQAQACVSNVWEAATIERRNKAMQELDRWLQNLHVAWGKNLLTCTPADLVVYCIVFTAVVVTMPHSTKEVRSNAYHSHVGRTSRATASSTPRTEMTTRDQLS